MIVVNYLKTHKIKFILLCICAVWYYFSLSKQLFDAPKSTVIQSVEGVLMGAKIAKDGQWRFPENE